MSRKVTHDRLRVPLDSTGKRARTQSRLFGPDALHEHFYLRTSQRDTRNYYHRTQSESEVASAQNGTSSGKLWIVNTSATVLMALRKLELYTTTINFAAATQSTRLAFARADISGTPSVPGPAGQPVRTGSPASAVTFTTALAGITVSNLALFFTPLYHNVLTNAGVTDGFLREWEPTDEYAQIVIGQGQGIAVYQADTGNGSIVRTAEINFEWEEFDA